MTETTVTRSWRIMVETCPNPRTASDAERALRWIAEDFGWTFDDTTLRGRILLRRDNDYVTVCLDNEGKVQTWWQGFKPQVAGAEGLVDTLTRARKR